MSFKYELFLDKGTNTLLDLLSSADISAEEKRLLVDTFTAELEKNIANAELAENPEQLIYSTEVKYLDDKISRIISDSNLDYAECASAIKICNRQEKNVAKFAENGWHLPNLVNQNIDNCRNTFIARQETCSISSKILDEDIKISQLFIQAEKQLNLKDCDVLSDLLSEFAEDLKICKKKKISLPSLKNTNTKKAVAHIAEIRKIAEQKEAMHNEMYELDLRLYHFVTMVKITSEHWDEIINICQQQSSLINACSSKQWPLPSLRYTNPTEIERMYQHYQILQISDAYLNSNRDSLKSKRKYREYLETCSKQCNNIELCRKNNWPLPELAIENPDGLFRVVSAEQKKRESTAKLKRKLVLVGVSIITILALGIFCNVKYREGKVQIPFDYSYVAEKEIDDIYAELNNAGFTNIIMKQDNSSWLESGHVLSVTIDNKDTYKKARYIKPDVSVIITYSSDNRLYITDYLKNWKNTDYETVVDNLRKAGFTNIMIESTDTLERDEDQLVSSLNLNGLNYGNEHCYLPANAPIIVTYNVLKINIGNNSAEFIGQNYEDVAAELEESGFTNVSTEKIMTGWAKENTVIGVNINNSDSYDKNSKFNPDVKIVVKYSSSNRVDITSVLSKWETSDYVAVKTELSNQKFTDVTCKEIITSDKSQNQLISSISINNEKFIQGDCFVQKSAPIVIEYYNLKITIGQKAEDFEENEEGEYKKIVSNLENMGFTNIQLQRNNDLINGWITKEGSVESISINGNSDFSTKDSFYYDDPIVIVVNTFSGKGCEDITVIAP